MKNKDTVITLTLSEDSRNSGLTLEATDNSVERLTKALALAICAVSRSLGIEPIAYLSLVSMCAMESINSEHVSIDLNAIRNGGKDER